MNYKDLTIILLLAGPTGSLIGMEEMTKTAKELKASDAIEIQLKDGKTTISPEALEKVKEASSTLKEMEHDVDFKEIKSLDLPYLDKDQFDLVLESIQAIEAGEIEDFLIAINKKDREQLLSLIDAADYLEVKAIMSLIGDAMKSLKEMIDRGNDITKSELVKALLIPKFIKLYKIDLDKQNRYGNTALNLAAYRGHKDIVELLIDAGADLDKQAANGQTALMQAASRGHADIVEFLIDAGADLDKQEANGQTALIWTTELGHKNIVELLIKAGANLEKQNNDFGWTALMRAAARGHKDIVKLLIEAGADLDKQDNAGWTALMLAADEGDKEIVELLIKAKADLDKQDNDGWTAIMWAANMDSKNVVELLIQAGADLDKQGKDGTTLLKQATDREWKEIVKLLRNAGADTKEKKEIK